MLVVVIVSEIVEEVLAGIGDAMDDALSSIRASVPHDAKLANAIRTSIFFFNTAILVKNESV